MNICIAISDKERGQAELITAPLDGTILQAEILLLNLLGGSSPQRAG